MVRFDFDFNYNNCTQPKYSPYAITVSIVQMSRYCCPLMRILYDFKTPSLRFINCTKLENQWKVYFETQHRIHIQVISFSFRYGRWVTRRVVVITIATIWLLAAFVSFVPISLGLHRPDDQPLIVDDNGKKYPTCALDLTPTYAVVSSCISFYFPCVVMIGIYCRWVLCKCAHFNSLYFEQLDLQWTDAGGFVYTLYNEND